MERERDGIIERLGKMTGAGWGVQGGAGSGGVWGRLWVHVGACVCAESMERVCVGVVWACGARGGRGSGRGGRRVVEASASGVELSEAGAGQCGEGSGGVGAVEGVCGDWGRAEARGGAKKEVCGAVRLARGKMAEIGGGQNVSRGRRDHGGSGSGADCGGGKGVFWAGWGDLRRNCGWSG